MTFLSNSFGRHNKSSKFCELGERCVFLFDPWLCFGFNSCVFPATWDYVLWESGFFVFVVNGSIYTGDGSSVEKDHPSSINTGRTMRRTIGVSCDSSSIL